MLSLAASTPVMSEFEPEFKNPELESNDEPIRIPVGDVFDLHTVPPRDVKPVVEAYLEEAHRLGLCALRIIHGRGIGVQRKTVRKVLERTPFVIDYRDAPAEAGGWGATLVTLGAPAADC